MEENTFISVSKDMMSFIEKSPTAFQVTANFMELLDDAGFVRLNERDRWHLIPGGKYYVTRNDSSIIAFRMPAAEGFIIYQIAAAHSDSPSFKVKENPELTPDKNYVSLNVEKYGGMLMAPWFDRPLSVAGRAIVREGAVLKPVLVNVDRDLCIIPNLAIHMNREANTGLNYNAQKDMIPLIGETESKGLFDSIIADAAQTDKESVISSDLFLYNRQAGTIWGADNEFISAPRLDDVMCAYSCMNALIDSDESNQESVAVCAVFDNEEVGSSTKQGADSTFLSDVLMRIAACAGKDNEDYIRACAGSFMLSADNAHAVHPNYQEKADPTNRPHMNKGIVIKYNANQKYTTDAVSAAIFKEICTRAGVPTQEFANRSDIPGGSTIWGADNEFISAPRLDDVMCAYSCMNALIDSDESNQESVAVCAVFDNEEVGSSTKQGADSTFLSDVLMRIAACAGKDNEDYIRACAGSFMLSADNAHAVHPNYQEKADPTNRPHMNKGIVIKYNANQKYTTDAVSAAIFKEICTRAGVPTQEFANRSDIPGGSTLGNIANCHVSMNTVDIGLAQLAMHSPYETAGIMDTEYMIKAVKEFFETAIVTNSNGTFTLE